MHRAGKWTDLGFILTSEPTPLTDMQQLMLVRPCPGETFKTARKPGRKWAVML